MTTNIFDENVIETVSLDEKQREKALMKSVKSTFSKAFARRITCFYHLIISPEKKLKYLLKV
jgi:hypothetical protein